MTYGLILIRRSTRRRARTYETSLPTVWRGHLVVRRRMLAWPYHFSTC